jgi:hypothetical protein
MQGNEDPRKEKLMLLLQWKRETINNGAENLKKFGDAIESLRLVNELEKDVVDGAADVRAEVEELPVYAMESGLQEIAFSRIFRVEQLQQL